MLLRTYRNGRPSRVVRLRIDAAENDRTRVTIHETTRKAVPIRWFLIRRIQAPSQRAAVRELGYTVDAHSETIGITRR